MKLNFINMYISAGSSIYRGENLKQVPLKIMILNSLLLLQLIG